MQQKNKQFSEKKKVFITRAKTSIIVVLYSLIIALFSLFGCVTNKNIRDHINWTWRENHIVQIVFAILLILAISVINILAIIELFNCCLKKTNSKWKYLVCFLSLLISVVPYLVIIPSAYSFIDKTGWDATPYINAYFIITFLGVLTMYILLLCLSIKEQSNIKFNKIVYPIVGSLLPLVFSALIYICLFKFFTTFIFLLCVVWLTDSLAYISGTLFGKHKMCEKISPKKTWEGFIISFFVSLILIMVLFEIYQINPGIQYMVFGFREGFGIFDTEWIWWIIMLFVSIFLILANTAGDLFFSVIKRKNGIKDFSNLLSGHGGMLDRIDSLTFVVILFITICFFSSFNTISIEYFNAWFF